MWGAGKVQGVDDGKTKNWLTWCAHKFHKVFVIMFFKKASIRTAEVLSAAVSVCVCVCVMRQEWQYYLFIYILFAACQSYIQGLR